MRNASFRCGTASSGLPSRKLSPPRLFSSLPTLALLGDLLVLRLRALGVLAREHPVALALGDQRRLEVEVRERAAVVRGPPRARARARRPRAPPRSRAGGGSSGNAQSKMLRAQQVGREARPLGELERRVEEAERRRDARELVAATPSSVEHLGALDVGEARALRRARGRARAVGSASRTSPLIARARASPASARTSSSGEPVASTPERSASNSSSASAMRSARISASARASPASTRPRSSAETPLARKPASTPSRCGEPLDRLVRRACLAALDLADVLLREALAGELGLRQAGGDAELAQALAQSEGGGLRQAVRLDAECAAHADGARSLLDTSPERKSTLSRYPPKGSCLPRKTGQLRNRRIT